MFEQIKWLPDRALLGNLVFRLEQARDEEWELGDECFRFYKNQQLVGQYDRFWSGTSFRPRHALEIGIWDGGSTALWYEHLRPERLVAIDIEDRQDSPYFHRYVTSNVLGNALVTHWRTDQADRAALLGIVERDLDGEIDLVIDDGSHLDKPTRASFEALFPLLPPGGLYIIEDWAWEHWPEFQSPNHLWAGERGLGAFVSDLAAATGSSRTLIRSLSVYEGFVVVERGPGCRDRSTFHLADHIVRRRQLRSIAPQAASGEDVKVLAFYLPQFHPIPENDRWWGKGYTEWTRVARAQAQFAGHYQPHVPERLGYYDLRLPEVRAQQGELARAHGIYGFCYYYYSFGTKKLLDRPLLDMLSGGQPDMPFCVCWANENWTRRWDGSDQEILIEQRYSAALDIGLIEDLLPFFRDPRYVRVCGAPVLVVYRPDRIPDPLGTVERWRQAAQEHGLGGLHLVAALTFGVKDPRILGFDAAVEFPPHGLYRPEDVCGVDGVKPGFGGTLLDFSAIVKRQLAVQPAQFRLYRTAMAGWDNTPRLGQKATIFHGACPEEYEKWLRALIIEARRGHPDHRFVFVNAWNEWAEGAHLEPDTRFGTGYLEATRRALEP